MDARISQRAKQNVSRRLYGDDPYEDLLINWLLRSCCSPPIRYSTNNILRVVIEVPCIDYMVEVRCTWRVLELLTSAYGRNKSRCLNFKDCDPHTCTYSRLLSASAARSGRPPGAAGSRPHDCISPIVRPGPRRRVQNFDGRRLNGSAIRTNAIGSIRDSGTTMKQKSGRRSCNCDGREVV